MAQLVLPRDASWTTPGETGDILTIPMLITSYIPRSKKPKVNTITTLPMVDVFSGTAFGGNAVAEGPQELAKITVEGTMDTPTVSSGGWQVPAIMDGGGERYTYAEIILACIEGRYQASTHPLSSDGYWYVKTEPLSFTDPYGRVFNSPRIFDFSASYVEAVPGRNSFSMTLVVQ